MLDGFARLFAARPITQMLRDLLDIFIVAYVIYRALLVLRGTRAIQMGVGLGVVFLVYLGAKIFNFVTLLSLLGTLLSSIILIVVVVFQNDIRRALIRMGGTAWLSGGREQQSRVIDEVVAAATELARHRMGALIAFEQDANILEFVKSEGIPLECVVTRELLVTLFVPESVNKLHDGAVLIRDLKIARAGVFFPMPETKVLDAQLGSRHRAALGITEETDAVVVVVSEERGTISFCFSGNIVSNLDGQSLRHALLGLFGRANRKKRAKKATTIATPMPSPVRASKEPSMRSSVVHPPPALDAATADRSRSEKLERLEAKGGPMPNASALKTPPAATKATSTPMKPTREPERPSLVDPIEAGSNPATTTPTPRSTFVPTQPHKPGEDS
jgi:diadenylate cyclase